ncbi:MAG: aminotransferase class III-fold pyridoxal phosphate-dependent enzyme, partial [Planctomycetes bacterium]|nr:aminotransferase class III-fold pyridoxal phosphate-dependent enzyme [Planctomycetota bacterium]
MLTFERLESSVRWYARSFPAVFAAASGSLLRTEDGREVIDFLSGAGALNYGHNHPSLVRGAIRYLLEGGIVHGLDLATTARRRFLETFDQVVLEPRGLTYRMQFTGPTGTNAVEAAIKLAWKFTGREGIVRFDGSYHGMTLGSLAISEAGRS